VVKQSQPVIAFSYLRFSHPNQSTGDSVRRQHALRDDWLRRHPEVKLDTSLTLEDHATSGFTGRHRGNADRHALARFLELVRDGRVPRGSYLIVENLDRLSREHVQPALQLFLELTQAGVRLVQLSPAESVFDDQSDLLPLLVAIMEMARGHGESAMKSERIGAAWAEKKRQAAEHGVPLTARAPAWLRLVEGRWEVIDSAAQAVRMIFKMATEGFGLQAITRQLNEQGVPVIGKGERWVRGYVGKLVRNRSVIGEYRLTTGRGAERQCRPLPGYFPAILSEEEWYAARAGLEARREQRGRPAKGVTNLFVGLLRDARGGPLHLAGESRRDGTLYKVLVGARVQDGARGPGPHASFPYHVFEECVLGCLRELNPRDILPHNGHENKVLVLTGRLAEAEAEVEKIKGRMEAKGFSEPLADVLERQAAKRQQVADELAAARMQASSPLAASWGDYASLLDVLENAPNPDEVRTRLRSALRRITQSIHCLFLTRGRLRVAVVQAKFQGGARREFLIVYRGGTANKMVRRPAEWWVRSMADVGPAHLDLSRPADAAKLERALAGLDWNELLQQPRARAKRRKPK
jgi:DNA invertase Pin-like site-specific DNA recombinase